MDQFRLAIWIAFVLFEHWYSVLAMAKWPNLSGFAFSSMTKKIVGMAKAIVAIPGFAPMLSVMLVQILSVCYLQEAVSLSFLSVRYQ